MAEEISRLISQFVQRQLSLSFYLFFLSFCSFKSHSAGLGRQKNKKGKRRVERDRLCGKGENMEAVSGYFDNGFKKVEGGPRNGEFRRSTEKCGITFVIQPSL